jgi:hypothetical protein
LKTELAKGKRKFMCPLRSCSTCRIQRNEDEINGGISSFEFLYKANPQKRKYLNQ